MSRFNSSLNHWGKISVFDTMNKTAIILFAHLPEFEARAKSFCGFSSQKATKNISSILTYHFYDLAKKTTAETFLIDTLQQKGKTFGERIAKAFADIYAKGFENVICIGNDCPDLQLKDLQHSITQIEAGNIVLGPTFDGGAYLIGIPKQKFDQQNFQQIGWQGKQTFKDLLALFNSDVIELGTLADIDKTSDFSFSDTNNPLVKNLFNVIKSFKPIFGLNTDIRESAFLLVDASFLKGPPLFSI